MSTGGGKWVYQQESVFITLKEMLRTGIILAHFDPSFPIGISCDTFSVGIGAVLIHRFPDGSERPIANVSESLSETKRRYSQIQKEALSIVLTYASSTVFLCSQVYFDDGPHAIASIVQPQ